MCGYMDVWRLLFLHELTRSLMHSSPREMSNGSTKKECSLMFILHDTVMRGNVRQRESDRPRGNKTKERLIIVKKSNTFYGRREKKRNILSIVSLLQRLYIPTHTKPYLWGRSILLHYICSYKNKGSYFCTCRVLIKEWCWQTTQTEVAPLTSVLSWVRPRTCWTSNTPSQHRLVGEMVTRAILNILILCSLRKYWILKH